MSWTVDGFLRWLQPQLVVLVLWAAGSLAVVWVSRVVWRERMLRRVLPSVPVERRAQLRRDVRAVPLLTRTRETVPADPFALTQPVVVPPLGDGRPGESFLAPGPPRFLAGDPGEGGSRTDATVALAPGTFLLVVCLGRLGSGDGDHVLRPAAERARGVHAGPPQGATTLGPVDRVPCRLGEGWRVTFGWATGRSVTDTHVDRDGWAFVVGVLSSSWHSRAVAALDAILATWVWLPPAAPPPAAPAPAAPPPAAPAPGGVAW